MNVGYCTYTRNPSHIRSAIGTAERPVLAFFLAGIACVTAGCKGKEAPPPPPTPKAEVSKPVEQEVVKWDEYPGRLEAPNVVTVSARVSGVIDKAPFDEGSYVRKGDLLFLIDDRPFAAELKSREADILRAQSGLEQANAHFKRLASLKGTKAISGEDYDEAFAAFKKAQSDVAVAAAARDIAKLSLEWTRVAAPIDGRISRKLVTQGNLISGGTGQATPLTVITSVDPLYCYANVPEDAFLRYQELAAPEAPSGKDEQIPAFIRLSNGKDYPHSGRIDFIDPRVSPSTGTVEIRAVIPNPDRALSPGLFARMRIPGSPPGKRLLVPDAAIGTNQDSRFVLVLGEENKVEQRPVTLGPLFGTLRAVAKGLEAEDQVVLTGLQQLRPGTQVIPQEGNISTESLTPYLATTESDNRQASLAPALRPEW